jgi:hypothetical protein
MLDSFNNMLVAGAAAEVAREGMANLIFGGAGIFFQKGDEGHQNARGAEAALEAVFFPKTLL